MLFLTPGNAGCNSVVPMNTCLFLCLWVGHEITLYIISYGNWNSLRMDSQSRDRVVCRGGLLEHKSGIREGETPRVVCKGGWHTNTRV